MKTLSLLLASAALVTLPISAASADCREEIALLQDGDMTASISGSASAGGATTDSGLAANTGPAEGKTTNFETGEGVDVTGEVTKDGDRAPLETDETVASSGSVTEGTAMAGVDVGRQTDAGTGGGTTNFETGEGLDKAGEVTKDGDRAPLETGEQVESQASGNAMSGQDTQSQQDGDMTAADAETDTSTMAAADAGTGGFQDAVERAEAALAAGDEEACMAAVAEAKAARSQ
ncbi:hypothetical protein VQ042_13335 [Aurantimonas sp. A2-1-M11]|uniref:hypothetical protein n=1 Tax=Aurantimonas sp. A2-1-M11 TaxID=3113712 RepID=UPI002F927B98